MSFNDISFIGLGLLSDMACVYTLGHQPDSVVNNNICHDVESFGCVLERSSSSRKQSSPLACISVWRCVHVLAEKLR